MIKKFRLTTDTTIVPKGQILLVAEQSGYLTVWINDEGSDKHQTLHIKATGDEVPLSIYEHVGSAVVGHFVWHVFR